MVQISPLLLTGKRPPPPREGLSFKSSIFTDAKEELTTAREEADAEGREFTPSDVGSYLEGKNIDIKDFLKAHEEWEADYEAMDVKRKRLAGEFSISEREKGEGGVGVPGRIAGKMFGLFGEGIGEALPEPTREKAKDIIARIVGGEQQRQELFFPATTGLEKGAAFMGDLLLVGSKLSKGVQAIARFGRVPQVVTGAEKLGAGEKTKKFLRRIGTGIAYGTGFAATTTVIEPFKENWVELLSEWKGDAVIPVLGKTVDEVIGKLKVNPDDTKAEKYLRTFVGNLILEGTAAGAFLGVGPLAKSIGSGMDGIGVGQLGRYLKDRTIKYTDYVVPQSMKDIYKGIKRKGAEWLTSRYGLTDDAVRMVIERKGANREALTQAAQMSDDLARALRAREPWRVEGVSNYTLSKEGREIKKNYLDNVVNEALAGSKQARAILEKDAPEALVVVDKMRENLIGLGLDLQKITKGELQFTIGDNLETYLNRTYRIYDDPNYLRGGVKDLPDDVLKNAEDFFRKEGIEEQDIPAVIRYYTEGLQRGEQEAFHSTFKGSRTSDILKSRTDVPKEIRALWGEIKDPYINYTNSFRKAANLLSEYKFRDEIAEEALRVGRATEEAYVMPAGRVIPIGDVVEEGVTSAGRGVGALGGAAKGGVEDPLQNLFVDPVWKKAIDNGMEIIYPDNGLINTWLKAKGLSQAMATIYSIPTHGVNTLGNSFIMLANGTLNPAFAVQGFKDLTRRFIGQASGGRGTAEGIPEWAKKIGVRDWTEDQLAGMPEWAKKVGVANLSEQQLKRLPPNIRNAVHTRRTINKYEGTSMGKSGMADRVGYYQRLGIIDSNIGVEQLARTAKESLRHDNFNSFLGSIMDKNQLTRGGAKATKWGSDRFLRLYEAEDNLFKIWNFEQLKAAYGKPLANMSEEALDNFVAQRSRDMMPNYNMIPKVWKSTRGLPVGNFLAFPVEMVRNGKNIMKYAWKDISGRTAKELGITDPKLIAELRNIGLKRAAGMTSAILAGEAAKRQSMEIFGISNEQDKSLNKILQPWETFQPRIYTAPIERDKEGNIMAEYMNLGQIDPQTYWKAPATEILALMINGADYNEAEIDQAFLNAAKKVVSPFAGPAMITDKMMELIRGEGLPENVGEIEKLGYIVGELGRTTLIPKTYDWWERRQEFFESQEKRGEGREVTKYGFPIAKGRVDFPALFGFKRQKVNLSQGLSWNIGNEIYARNDAYRPFRNTFRDYSISDPQIVMDEYVKTFKLQHKLDQLLKGKYDAYKDLGFTDEDIVNALTAGGFKEQLMLEERFMKVGRNEFEMPQLPDSLIPFAEEVSEVPVPYGPLIELKNQWDNSPIE